MPVSLKKDFVSGFSVFLLALPLCLGIAAASHFPASAGILSAIVGGLVAAFLGGAKLAIKGPAAGLIVIAVAAVTQLGEGDLVLGYERTLAVGVMAAGLQIIFGAWKKAGVAEMIPASVIHAILAAIGIIIISQQLYVILGVTAPSSEPLDLFLTLPSTMNQANPLVLLIGLVSLGIIVGWPRLKISKFLPATLILLLITIPLAYFADWDRDQAYVIFGQSYPLTREYFINIPTDIKSAIIFPDFSQVFTATSLKYVLMFALVGSIESTLIVRSIKTFNPNSPPADLNADLRAVGMANLLSSFLGGLPMISEIVRTKANIDHGATSHYSNAFHGLFMLLAMIALPGLVNLIPLAALGALLIYVGFRLASLQQFKEVYLSGKDQFAVFSMTLMVTLVSNLLVGIAAGVLLNSLLSLIKKQRTASEG